jgi:hypothetical protein
VDSPAITPAAQRGYDQIVERMEQEHGVKASRMFGMPALLLDRKAFAGLYGDAMVFKLSGDAHTAALGLAGAELFDPSQLGRPMKAWVVVPASHAGQWDGLADQAWASAKSGR